MSKYIYENPIERGYAKFKLTKKQHNQLFKNKKIKWKERYEYYIDEKGILLHKFVNWKAVVLCTIFFPVFVLYGGIVNFKECCTAIKELYSPKKYGCFASDYITRKGKPELYESVLKIINME